MRDDWATRPISELATEYNQDMEPRDITYGPADPGPVPVCDSCGSDNVRYDGGSTGWCLECRENRTVVDEDDWLARNPGEKE